MSDDDFQPGTIQRLEQGFEGRLERFYGHDPAAVWAMLTQPPHLAQWLAPGTIELRQGGAVRIDFADSGIVIDSTVTALEPQRVLEYSWSSGSQPARPIRWELAEEADGTRLTLTVRLPGDEDAAKACAGFDGHLDMLAAALENVPVRFPLDLYLRARKHYQTLLDA
ncbi:SRPBCC family protein [Castellaniella defragrans]|uniref:SRPBCC family protein n=1 Tax=Castellaniella defragrans TaxID=75697 RepID=UPI002AFF527B|nr:SRPBCC family protein [Castellaniella defragrans]